MTKLLLLFCVCSAVTMAESPEQKGYDIQWKNEMRLFGTHPDTIQMFLDAPTCIPPNDTTGLPILGSKCKVISSDGTRGWLWVVEQSADIKRTESSPKIKRYSSFVINPILVFDTRESTKK